MPTHDTLYNEIYYKHTDRHMNIHIAGFLKIMLCSSKMASNIMGQMGQIVQMSQIGQMGQFDREKVMAGWVVLVKYKDPSEPINIS